MKSLLILLLVILCLTGVTPAGKKKRHVEVWIRPDQNYNNNNQNCNWGGCDK